MADDVFAAIRAELLQAKQQSGRSYTELADRIAISGGPILGASRIRKILTEYHAAPTSAVLGSVTRELGLDWNDVRARAYGRD